MKALVYCFHSKVGYKCWILTRHFYRNVEFMVFMLYVKRSNQQYLFASLTSDLIETARDKMSLIQIIVIITCSHNINREDFL